MKIERAVREKTFTLTSIAGPSGSGKTYSALLYARGMVGPSGKIGFIDTENKRSRFYAEVGGGFDVIDLDPPFTSARYIEAIKTFEKAGYTAIIIDSISHEWEGSGGVLEQAEAIEERTKRAGLHCWQKPKAAHKKLMNELLQTRAHLIFCCRVKEKVVQTKGRDGKSEIVNEGFVVVQEKSFIYEMTVSMMLEEGTHVPLLQKCPGDLYQAFPQGDRISVKIGDAVREWSDQGEEVDTQFEDIKREGVVAAGKGMPALLEWWKSIDKEKQSRLENLKETLKSIARAYDQMVEDQMDAGGGDVGDRLQHARNQAEKPTDTGEGFNREFVWETLLSVKGIPETDDAPPQASGADEITSPETEDAAVDPAPKATAAASSSLFKWAYADGELIHLRDFSRKALDDATSDNDAPAKDALIERMRLDYMDVISSDDGIMAINSILKAVAAVINGKRTREQSADYICREFLDCDLSALEGRA